MKFLSKNILLEAEKDDNVDEPEATDYADLGSSNDDDDNAVNNGEGGNESEETDESDTDETNTDTPDEVESTDYTVDEEEATPSDETADDDTTNTEPETDESMENEANPSELESNRILMQDYVNLYEFCQSLIGRINGISKSDLLINQVLTQISANINLIEQQLYEYIIFKFKKRKYPLNLYKYNQFVLALKINVEMLKKINLFTTDSQNN